MSIFINLASIEVGFDARSVPRGAAPRCHINSTPVAKLLFLKKKKMCVMGWAQLPVAWAFLRANTHAHQSESTWHLGTSEVAMSVSLIMPAFNEKDGIVDAVTSALSMHYPDLEIIVVNDGSTDGTLAALITAFGLKPIERAHHDELPSRPIRAKYGSKWLPHLMVVDKENGGCKADASNAGINCARNDLVCVIDADSMLEPDSLMRVVRPFTENKHMIASGGTIRILNGCEITAGRVTRVNLPHTLLLRFQMLEYIRVFLGARLALSRWGLLTIIAGAFSVFRRDVVVQCGGFDADTVGEDYDLVMKMHRWMRDRQQPYSMQYVADSVCWTEAPADLKTLRNQRVRWQIGALQVFWKHRDMLLNPRYGRIGWLAMPLAVVADVMEPIVEWLAFAALLTGWSLGLINTHHALDFMATLVLLGLFVTVTTLTMDAAEARFELPLWSRLQLVGLAVLEFSGYHQFINWWRIQGWWRFLSGNHQWGRMKRMERQLALHPRPPTD